MIGRLFGVDGVVKAGKELYEGHQERKFKKLELADRRHERELKASSKSIERAALANGLKGLWRPVLMLVLTLLTFWYFFQAFIMFGAYFYDMRFGDGAGLSSDERYLIGEYVAMGTALLMVLGAFGGVTSWSRGKEKVAGKAASSTSPMSIITDRLPTSEPEIVHKPVKQNDGPIKRMDGIDVPKRTAKSTNEPSINNLLGPAKNYFSRAELECKGIDCNCEFPGMDPVAMMIANDLREYFGLPVVVNSAFRCPIHNAKVGGSKNSFHLKGQALDIRIHGVTPKQIYDYLVNKYPKKYGFGLYNSFVHLDSRMQGWARKPAPDQKWRWFKKSA